MCILENTLLPIFQKIIHTYTNRTKSNQIKKKQTKKKQKATTKIQKVIKYCVTYLLIV